MATGEIGARHLGHARIDRRNCCLKLSFHFSPGILSLFSHIGGSDPTPGLCYTSCPFGSTVMIVTPVRRLLAILQLPPPVHGATAMNEAVLSSPRLREMFKLSVLPLR